MNVAGKSVPHESARGHVTGEALYTDDLVTRFPGILHAWPVLAPHTHAMVTRLDAAPALEEPGVLQRVLTGAETITLKPGSVQTLTLKLTDPSR